MRGLIGAVIFGVIVLGVVALVALGPRRFEGILPAPAVAALDRVAAALPFGEAAARTGDTPADFLDDTAGGLVAAGPIAALPGNRPVFIADVLSGHRTSVGADIPAEITTIRPIMGCLLTPPGTGTAVAYVTAGDSGRPVALSTYNDDDLAAAVQALVDRYRTTGDALAERPEGLAYQLYDVAVTETSAPVYLVLETGPGNRLWNIHLAPGARIERVVLLGGDQAGVANLDALVPVEVLLNDGLTACGLQPAQAPTPAEAAADPVAAAARLPLAEAYARWLRDSFGIDADQRAGFAAGGVSVAGPVPAGAEGLALYAPVSAAQLQITRDTFFEIAGQVPEGEDFAARVTAIATSFAFGDLATLRQGADF